MSFADQMLEVHHLLDNGSYIEALNKAKGYVLDSKNRQDINKYSYFTVLMFMAYKGLNNIELALNVLSDTVSFIDDLSKSTAHEGDTVWKASHTRLLSLKSVLLTHWIDTLIDQDKYSEASKKIFDTIEMCDMQPYIKNQLYHRLAKIALKQKDMGKAMQFVKESSEIPNLNKDQEIQNSGLYIGVIKDLLEEYYLDNSLLEYLQRSIKLHIKLNLVDSSIEDSNKVKNKFSVLRIDDIYYLGLIYYKRGSMKELQSLWEPFINATNRLYFSDPKYIPHMKQILETFR